MSELKNEFRMYLRDKNKRPYGIIVAKKVKVLASDKCDKLWIGWSQCNKKDEWNRERGLCVAYGRMSVHFYDDSVKFNDIAPQRIREVIPQFFDKIYRYYKLNIDRNIELPKFIQEGMCWSEHSRQSI